MSQNIITEIRRKLPIISKRESPADHLNAVFELSIDDIIPNRSQPRSAFNQNAIVRLADSIRRYGILQPLTVRKILIPNKGTKNHEGPTTSLANTNPTYNSLPAEEKNATVFYELIAGERRLRAARLAELTTVPCIIVNTDDATSAELAIIENLLREDLNMFEQAAAFRKLIDEFMLTQEEVARRVSLSQSAVANKLRLLRLSENERKILLSSGLTERHARALLKIQDDELRLRILQHIVEKKMNVSASENYIDSVLDELCRYQCKKNPESEKICEISEHMPLKEEFSEEIHQNSDTGNEKSKYPMEKNSISEEMVAFSRKPRFKGAIKDMQLFYNSIRNATSILEQAGIKAQLEKQEDEEGIVLTIRLTTPKCDKPI